MKPLRMALTKGRLEKDTVALLERIGYDCEAVHNKICTIITIKMKKVERSITRAGS